MELLAALPKKPNKPQKKGKDLKLQKSTTKKYLLMNHSKNEQHALP